MHHELLTRLCRARDVLRDLESEGQPNVDHIARAAGVSRFYFTRLFKAVFGETPRQCRSHARLEQAKRLLVVRRMPVTDVCMAVGFSSLGSFSDGFCRRVGVPPSVYQKNHHVDPGVPDMLPRVLTPGCLTLMAGWPVRN